MHVRCSQRSGSTSATLGNVPAVSNTRIPWRVVASCAIGSIFEYYDFFVYGPLAVLVFPDLFFPGSSSAVKVILSMSTFVVGFVARPVGGVVFGHWGDRLGRKPMLMATFFITGFATFAVGWLPTYAQAGIVAPALLTALRFLQGFGIGGEWSGASLLATEHSTPRSRGFVGSLIQAGAPVGVISATLSVTLLSAMLGHAGLLAWGWRVPFLASFVLVALGLFLRMKVQESPEFESMKARGSAASFPAREALRRAPLQILAAIGVHTADTTLGFVLGIFVLGYATSVLHFHTTAVLIAVIAGSIANLIVAPLAGRLSDRFGTTSVLLVASFLMVLWAFPMFLAIKVFAVAGVFVAIIVGQVIVSLIFSPMAAFFRELFAPEIRYSGSSIGFQVATIVGALSPMIAEALQKATGGATWPISTYVAAIGLVAFGCVFLVRRALEPLRAAQSSADAMVGHCCAPSAQREREGASRSALRKTEPQGLNEEAPGMVGIPGGRCLLGGADQDAFPEDGEGPIREVELAPFSIAALTVTNSRFARFIEATGYVSDAERYGWSFVFYAQVHPSARDRILKATVPPAPWWPAVEGACWRAPDGPGSTIQGRENHPVVHVSWFDAAAYAAWCDARLPTEAEWEYAARGGLVQARYPWGDVLTPAGEHQCNIWQGKFPDVNTGEDGYLGTSPADAFHPNGFGLYCIAGNVWEWCSDWWSTQWHARESEDTRINPRGPKDGSAKVIRGGSYLCHDSFCNRYRVSARTFNTPDSSTSHMGFRCAMDAA